jgi:dihydrofolate synthase / folylpolyglutamate synthase
MNEINIDKAYQNALDYLYSFIDYSLTRMDRNMADKFDLSRVSKLLELLGNPHQQYRVIHVAGTKGKGSASAMMASVLQKAGYRVGFYTSPHLIDFTERIRVDGETISREIFVSLIDEIKQHVEKIANLTTFEITTVIGLWYFARQGVEVGVIEVGLGGRVDSTNVVDPIVSVITALSMDHISVLGDTLAKIAFEKAGIIKPGRPIVLAPQKEEARRVVERVAVERDAPLIQVGRDFMYAPWTHSLSGQSFLVWSVEEQPLVDDFIESGGRHQWEPLRFHIPLLGHHQVENAAVAYTALQVANQEGLHVSDEEIREGFADVFWPGRFETLRLSPPIIVDSAHNPDAALKMRLAIEDYLPDQPVILIFGASEDKDIRGMFAHLLPRVRSVIATQSFHPRAIAPERIVEIAHQFGCPAQAINPVEAALAAAIESAGKEAAILATGSLFIASAVREIYHTQYQSLRVFPIISE